MQSQLLVIHFVDFPKSINKGFAALSKHCYFRAQHVHLWLKQWQAFGARLPVISCLSVNWLGRDGWKGLKQSLLPFHLVVQMTADWCT